MAPVIGVTSQVVRQAKWYKFVRDLGFEAVEINRQHSKLHFNLFFLEKVKKYLHGLELSVHSATSGMFQPCRTFTLANLAVLTAEVDVCRFLGASQLVFHLNQGLLTPDEKKSLGRVMAYARKSGVKMLYESNSNLVADYALDVLESFPELGYVLDLGHLNNGYGNGKLGCEINEFLSRVKNRVVYVHASNNSGRRDEHKGLDDGTLNWRYVLDRLDLSQVSKIIVEVRYLDMVAESGRLLAGYLDGEEISSRYCAVAS